MAGGFSQQTPKPQLARQVDPLATPAGEAVLRMKGVSGDDVLAWRLLYLETHGGRRRIAVTPKQMADFRNRTDKTGKQRLVNMESAGLIKAVEKHTEGRLKGSWVIELLDIPDDDDTSHLTTLRGDPQHELDFATDTPSCFDEARPTGAGIGVSIVPFGATEEAPEVPPEVPRRASLLLEKKNFSTSILKSFPEAEKDTNEGLRLERAGGSSRGSSRGSSEPRPIGSSILATVEKLEAGALVSRPNPMVQQQNVDRFVAWVFKWVDDRTLIEVRVRELGWRIERGEVEQQEIDAIRVGLERQRQMGELRSGACYFNRSLTRIYARRGLPLPSKNGPKPR